MIYISKGIAGKASTTELVQVIRGSQNIYLSDIEADLWLKGRFSFAYSQTPDEERAGGNPVCGFFYPDYRFLVYVSAKPVYAKCPVGLRQGGDDYRAFER